MERTIRVTGKGRLRIKPDTIRMNIEISGQHRDYDRAVRRSSESTEIIKDLIEKLGYERKELKTRSFSIDTKYESYQAADKSWKRRFMGYSYTHSMKLEFPADNDRLGRLLYALAHCTEAPEFSVEYTVADTEKSKNELLGAAVRDSLEKASVIAAAAGVRLGAILNIDYSWGEINFVSRPMHDDALKCAAVGANCEAKTYDIDIDPEDIDVSDTVTVVWALAE